jgi:hypothetical protein
VAIESDRSAGPEAPNALHLALLSGLAAVCGLVCATTTGPVRWLAAILLIGYLPGRAVRVALRSNPLDRVGTWVVDVALSLCCVAFAGLTLNYFRPGIQSSTMLPVLVAIAIIGPLVSLVRSRRSGGRGRPVDWRSSLKADALPVGVFLLLAAVALAIGISSANSSVNRVKTTNLSIVSNQSGAVVVTITNWERAAESYRLLLSMPGRDAVTYRLHLRSGGTRDLSVPTAGMGAGQRVTASLYFGASSSPYRQVWLTLPGSRDHASTARL